MKKTLLMLCALELGAFEVIIDHPAPEAQKDFQYHWKKMTGHEAPLKVAKHPYTVSKKSFYGEAFRLRSEKNKVFISGESPIGVSHGLYELLQQLGCDWVMPGSLGEIIPANPDPKLPDQDIEQAPSFDYRNPWTPPGNRLMKTQYAPDYALWKVRHKLSHAGMVPPQRNCGGHKWKDFIRLYQKQFDANPEMYALVRQPDGTFRRQGPQIETTNPKLLDLYEKHIRNMFRKNKWPHDKLVGIGVGPADGGGSSESKETMDAASGKRDPLSGNPEKTDVMILFCNQLLERLEKDFPNLYLGFYLYSWHADYPVRYQIHPKIVLVIADISYSRMHSTLEEVPTRHYYRNILKKWEHTPNMKFFRGYNWNLAENILPYSKLKMWADDLPLYHKLGIRGVDNESNCAWATLAPSNYFEAKMLWNVNSDPAEVLHRFCRSAYGKAAPPLEQYYRMLTKRQSEAKQEAGSFHSFGLIYDNDFLDRADQLFDRARKLAETPEQKQRVEMAYIPVRQLRLFLTMRAKMHAFEFAEAEKLFRQIQQERQAEIKKNPYAVSAAAVSYFNRFFQDCITAAAKYSSAPYKIVYRLPEQMPVAFDPTSRGEELGFAAPETNDRDWLRMKTYSSTWAAQGLIGISGSVWFRARVPKLTGDLGLLIGGADRIVKVYCNGKFIGTDRGFSKPMLFDLTGHLNRKSNLLAIQVERRGNAEVGTGGLLYPSYIFTGPRLPKPADKEEQYRLLPGGAVEKIKK